MACCNTEHHVNTVKPPYNEIEGTKFCVGCYKEVLYKVKLIYTIFKHIQLTYKMARENCIDEQG